MDAEDGSASAVQPDRDAARPLWEQVRDDLMRRLALNEFRESFPGEHALSQQYGVSRYTVRQALRGLRDDGMVTADRGRAPRVAANVEIEQPLGALYSLFSSVEAAGLEQLSVVRILDVRADQVAAGHLGVDACEPLLHLERLRLAGGEPLAVDRVWLPARVARPLLRADFTRTALYDELARRCGLKLTGGQETLRAVIPTETERGLLGIGADTAAFRIDRLGCAEAEAVEWRHTIVRGDRFSVTAQFSGRSGYRVDLAGRHHPAPPSHQGTTF